MIRSFLVALVTVVVVSGPGALGRLAAQPANTASQSISFPITVEGGTPGVSIEFYLNAGKLADATANSTGGVDSILDMGNMGKTTVQIYIDVCKDGKVVKVLFVTAGNQPPPKDEDCDRRLTAVSFQSDCGVTQITLNFANFGANVIGCGGLSFRDPKILGTIGGGLIGGLLLFNNGDDGPTAVAAPVQLPVTVVTPVIPPVNTSTPAPAPPQFTVTMPVGSWTHPTGSNTSFVCTVVITTPAQPGAQWTATVQGPFVVPGQNFSGTLNARGQAEIRASISNVGSYTFTVTVVSSGVGRSGNSNSINVTGFNNNCPQAQSLLAP
jgi:hypothetical protein